MFFFVLFVFFVVQNLFSSRPLRLCMKLLVFKDNRTDIGDGEYSAQRRRWSTGDEMQTCFVGIVVRVLAERELRNDRATRGRAGHDVSHQIRGTGEGRR